MSVLFSHGVWEGFDRAESDEGTDLTITVFVGTLRGVAERQARGEDIRFTLQAIIRRAVVTFGSPIGDHRLVDGATGATLTTE